MASSPMLDDPNQSTQRAKTRIAVATVLLAVAIGGLALISRNKTEEKQTVPNNTGSAEAVVDNKSAPSASQNVVPTTMSSEEQEPPLAPKSLPTPEELKPEPSPSPPPPPTVSTPEMAPPNNAPVKKLLSKPVPVTPIHNPELSPPEMAPKSSKPIQQAIAPPQSTKPTHVEPSTVTQKTVQKTDVPAKAESVQPTTVAVKNYEVQLGVFTDMENAKQLQAKLTQNGIASHSETRVQVGPFANKAEADAAKEKLKALGIGAVVVPGK